MIKQAELTFEVHCQYAHNPPRYRVYVDSDLITERTYSWEPRKFFIEEHVIIEAMQGEHKLKIENVDPDYGFFTIKNIKLDGVPTPREFSFDIV